MVECNDSRDSSMEPLRQLLLREVGGSGATRDTFSPEADIDISIGPKNPVTKGAKRTETSENTKSGARDGTMLAATPNWQMAASATFVFTCPRIAFNLDSTK